jgi:hypothetical protein
MNRIGFEGLRIRTGLAIRRAVGYLLACDPKTEERSPHAKVFVLQDGNRFDSWVKFNAHAMCKVDRPEPGVIMLCSEGFYAYFTTTVYAGSIFREALPLGGGPRFGSFRSVARIAGMAYAIGLRGMVYRFDGVSAWTRIDAGVPEDFDGQAIAGFAADDLYAVGFRGQMMHYDGTRWTGVVLPTNANLTAVVCANSGTVYAAGHRGELISGRGSTWASLSEDAFSEDIWGLAWFQDALYVSSLYRVLRRVHGRLEPVAFGKANPQSCYQLSTGQDVLWSIGETDVVQFDGQTWTQVV